MPKQLFEKCRFYTVDKSKFVLSKKAFSIVFSTVTVLGRAIPLLWTVSKWLSPVCGEIAASCVWLFITNTIITILDLPFDIYYVFVLQESYSLNKQTKMYFIKFKIVEFLMYQFLIISIAALVVFIVQYGSKWFLVLIAECIGVLTLLTIYPSYLTPLFGDWFPLLESDLRTRLERLAVDVNFPLGQIYVVGNSIRSTHNSAYICGLFTKKHIVIFETLLHSSEDEILAIVSHELGHWKHGHITTNNIVMQVNLLFVFALFVSKFDCPLAYLAVGFDRNTRPLLVGLYIILVYVLKPYHNISSFIQTFLLRRFEFQADRFVSNIGQHEALRKALTRKLVRVSLDHLTFPVFDNLYSTWYLCYPSSLERLRALGTQPLQ